MGEPSIWKRLPEDCEKMKSSVMTSEGETPITINRGELFRRVWDQPLREIAEEFGTTVFALAKICEELCVPRPPRGHWTRVRSGIKDTRPDLPPVQPGAPTEIELAKEKTVEDDEDSQREAIEISPDLRGCHKLVTKTRRAFESARKETNGHLVPDGALSVRITRASMNRALRLMDAVVKALEARKSKVVVETDANWCYALIEGEKVHFSLTERIRRYEKDQTLESRRWGKEYEYEATGQLVWTIQERVPIGARKTWADGKYQVLDDRLPDVVAAMLATGPAVKEGRLAHEKWEREYEERRRQREIEWRQEQIEAAKRNQLVEKSIEWNESARLSQFIDAVEKDWSSKDIETGDNSAAREWLDWARRHANRLNPIKAGYPELKKPRA